MLAELVPWVPHPEVWVLIGGALAVAYYAARVIQPKAIAAGYEGLTGKQVAWFAAGLLGLWIASDWPIHDIAENYLYSVHMVQHLLISLILPAAFVLATPRWLMELVLPPGQGMELATQGVPADLCRNRLQCVHRVVAPRGSRTAICR